MPHQKITVSLRIYTIFMKTNIQKFLLYKKSVIYKDKIPHPARAAHAQAKCGIALIFEFKWRRSQQ